MITKNSLRTTRIVTNFLIIICIAVGLIYALPLLNYRQNNRYKNDLLSCTASILGEDDEGYSGACWVYLEDKQIWIMKSKMTKAMYNVFIENMNEKCSDDSCDESARERCKDYKDIKSWQLSEGGDEYIRGLSSNQMKLICRDILYFDGGL